MNEWDTFCHLVDKKLTQMNNNVEILQAKIVTEAARSQASCTRIVDEWQAGKPVDGKLKPSDALAALEQFAIILTSVHDDYNALNLAQQALGLPQTVSAQMTSARAELNDLRNVWT